MKTVFKSIGNAFVLLLALGASIEFRAQALRSVTVISEPEASVWVDGVLYGKTDSEGKLTIKTVSPGRKSIRVRADGFSELTKPMLPTQKGDFAVTLAKTTNAAELAFQEGERQSSLDRIKAAEAYRKALASNPKYVAAHVGLIRLLADGRDHEGALAAIRNLKKISPRNAEASAIEGRIYKDMGDEPKAIASFKRAIAEGRGFQPEAYAGLGLLYKERAEGLGDEDETTVNAANAEAAKNLLIAAKQLSGAPDAMIIYQLIGRIHESQKKYKEAIAVYEEFLRIFPDSDEAEAVRSFIVQIKKEMAEPQ